MKPAPASALALCVALFIVGCSGSGGRYGYEEPLDDYSPSEEYYEPQDYEPDYLDIPSPEPVHTGWSCYYDETFNYDWHDDVICSDGYESHRPYLLDWLDYVTYDDIMVAAAEYEASLNAGIY